MVKRQELAGWMMFFLLSSNRCSALLSRRGRRGIPISLLALSRFSGRSDSSSTADVEEAAPSSASAETTPTPPPAPWDHPRVEENTTKRKRSKNARFRQHVNPLARQFQQPTVLSTEWPRDVFDDCSRPLHLDIGCGKGGYLLETAAAAARTDNDGDDQFNYLGLEIRPLVAQYAKERIQVHRMEGKLDFVGTNANVDLERILTLYQQAAGSSSDREDDNGNLKLHRVGFQFPDPHFKSHHAKRRVVNPKLVDVVARFLAPGGVGQVLLQSDVQSVLDDMRDQFRANPKYFEDECSAVDEYLPENPWGIPTEREASVLKKDLPVYRALFRRTSEPYVE